MQLKNNIYYYEGDYIRDKKIYRGFGSSNFLILKNNEQTMIDTGFFYGRHKERLWNELKKDRINIFDTKNIILTHYHPDHIHGAKYLLKKNISKLWIHHDCEEYLLNDDFQFFSYLNFPTILRNEIFGLPKVIMRLFLIVLGYNFNYLRADHFFSSNEELVIDGFKIIPIPTYGHCYGHTSFYLPDQKIVFTGDLFSLKVFNGVLISNSNSDFDHGLNDIDALLSLDVEYLIPGHGQIIEGRKKIKDLLLNVKNYTIELKNEIYNLIKEHKRIKLSTIEKILFNNAGMNKYHLMVIIYNILKKLKKEKKICIKIINKNIWWETITGLDRD
ncbi:MAG: hypothetical protein A2Y34_00620 [Spirochaetes bacterium GWC1_27_15]|nr:MAG: hypothetical protein A2Y34_00620 [Spirochaetes bacterium GWC1_27_15]